MDIIGKPRGEAALLLHYLEMVLDVRPGLPIDPVVT